MDKPDSQIYDGIQINVTNSLAPDEASVIETGLDNYNKERNLNRNVNPVSIIIRDKKDSILAGMTGKTFLGWLHIKTIWVSPESRKTGLGRLLIKSAEEEAIKRKCKFAYLDTFSFQALGFYLKLGYKTFGELDNFPEGHKRHFLKKKLTRIK